MTVLLARTADLLRADDQFLDELAAGIDPTDASALVAAPRVLAARAIRQWLEHEGYPPDADAVQRVLAVAAGDAAACELVGGRRVRAARQPPASRHDASTEAVAWPPVMPSRVPPEAVH